MSAAQAYIRERIMIEDRGFTSPCWIWRLSPSSTGYGKVCIEGRRNVLAHRFSYELFVGAIPQGLQIDHLCRNRACVNPAHLEPVTCSENVRRGTVPSITRARWAAVTHCVQGHAFSPENTRQTDRQRICLTCSRAAKAAYKRRKRERVRAPAEMGGGGRPVGQGLSVTGSQTGVQVQNSKPIQSDFGDSNSPTNLAGEGGR